MAETNGKTAIKTARPSPRSGFALPVGAHPGNTGGKKGRSGRRPNWLREFCEELLADEESQDQVRAIVRDKNHPAFATMWRNLCERYAGKPEQPISASGAITLEIVRRALPRP